MKKGDERWMRIACALNGIAWRDAKGLWYTVTTNLPIAREQVENRLIHLFRHFTTPVTSGELAEWEREF